MDQLPKDRIDAIPVKWPAQEHLVSEAMKKPPEPQKQETEHG